MSQLVQINEYYIDPNRVISVAPYGDCDVAINVDMNSWTATYVVPEEEHGWNVDSVAEALDEARTP